MSEEYATTLGELRDVIEDAIAKHGENSRYTLVGCYQFTGTVKKEFGTWSNEEPEVVRLFTDLCSG